MNTRFNTTLSNHIDGAWQAGGGVPLVTIDPATGRETWAGTASSADDVDRAVRAARAAFEDWAMTPPAERSAVCLRFRDLLRAHGDELAALIAEEVGKPMWEARTEVATMANKIDISIQAHAARTGATAAKVADGHAVLRHRPHGVFGVFGPYNFPGHLPNGHIVPALIAGNTLVFKPSEYAPRTAMRTVQFWVEAGLPDGVLNLVNGGRETGVALARHPDLDGILFTGSSRTGIALHRQLAGRPDKMLALEMGGNNPLVVWDLAPGDIDAAVHHTVMSAFVSAGQRCTCARRLIVQDGPAAQAFLDRLVAVARGLRVGPPHAQPEPFMGPVVSAAVAWNLLEAQAMLEARGGNVLLRMRQADADTGFLTAGIVDVTDAQTIPDEEWFGPLLQVVRVATFDEALRAANATEFGLAAALLSPSPALWQRFAVKVRAGVVNWNRPTTGAASSAPFGGIGKSGNHRPSAYYAADYCAWPVASIETPDLAVPAVLPPGLSLDRP
ncbi:succinylglutamate-semialdehyde dehydrogenase [Massilia sp. NEAU-DD11]|uniref:N-succinylglutamate 5-semialdehyde dehydrogenase n=1 Tax=Massilia cellulosiltytica TaxID=2683234 RepID=A0A7X3FX34_9BURK|nr:MULTISPECIES: succinylglutamate-semialdehyde dehydrogenase [Telluria group]KQZ46968.1 N-succinylglutamate 5-semialdehyde dehydrogenase [Massilia sp. Root1485]MVW59561.1 succinylglutamate-semialdehyde dehydrogenase [Telluria cellulosilytica]